MRNTHAPIRTFQQTLFELQTRWGQHIVQRATDAQQSGGIATGITALDAILPLHGIPRKQLTAFSGLGSSGINTLALTIVASAQRQGDVPVVYFDVDESFDYRYATGCNIDLDGLLVVKPGTPQVTLEIAHDLIKLVNLSFLVLDFGFKPHQVIPSEFLGRLQILARQLRRSSAALVCLTDELFQNPIHALVTAQASLMMTVRQQQRLCHPYHPRNVMGCESQVMIVKSAAAAIETTARFPLYFTGVGAGE